MEELKIRQCRGCGTDVMIIKSGGVYGRVLVEAEEVWIRKQTGGDMFFTIDGQSVIGIQAGDAEDDPEVKLIPAYIPHKGRCPNNGRAPRKRHRPSGYR